MSSMSTESRSIIVDRTDRTVRKGPGPESGCNTFHLPFPWTLLREYSLLKRSTKNELEATWFFLFSICCAHKCDFFLNYSLESTSWWRRNRGLGTVALCWLPLAVVCGVETPIRTLRSLWWKHLFPLLGNTQTGAEKRFAAGCHWWIIVWV